MKSLSDFLSGIYKDPRIPSRDRKLIVVLLLLFFSPLDLLPDWIPLFGVIDDVMMLALIGDYFFRILDPEVFLGRWPFGLKSYQRLNRFFTTIVSPVPKFIRNALWKYTPSPYRKI